MKIKIYTAAFSAALFFGGVFQATETNAATDENMFPQDERCTVSDTTGKRLKVRSNPNGGKIVRKLKNGTKVYVVYETGDEQDRSWSKISLSNKGNAPVIGWVLTEFLDCP